MKVESAPGQLTKIFKFPEDGNKFKLDHSKQYKLKVNDRFWITLGEDQMTVQKDANGYFRSNKWEST